MGYQLLMVLVGGIIGIGGTLGAVLLTNLLQERRERRGAFIYFYKAFRDMIHYLHGGKGHPFGVIPQMIVSHEIAKNVFHRYLRKRDIRSFDEAWNEYYSECKKYCEPIQLNPERLPQCQEELLKRLNKFLAIAERN